MRTFKGLGIQFIAAYNFFLCINGFFFFLRYGWGRVFGGHRRQRVPLREVCKVLQETEPLTGNSPCIISLTSPSL